MATLCITAMGIHSERIADTATLRAALRGGARPAPAGDTTAKMAARLDPRLTPRIAREDLSILNDVSRSVLNALVDAAPLSSPLWSADHEATRVFASTDGAEYDFGPLATIAARHETPVCAVRHLGALKELVNPLGMLRHLSTNTVYHVSKQLGARGGGYPTQTMSLGSIAALEDAAIALRQSPAGSRAVVVASGNMRSFDSILVFDRLGLLDGRPGPGVVASFGSGALVLESTEVVPPGALAELLFVDTGFTPDPQTSRETWRAALARARVAGAPDVVVHYQNGAAASDAVEEEAVAAELPGVVTRRYKHLFGYTGKANGLLDLAAVLADPTVPVGSVVLLLGQGFGFGVGTATVRKLATGEGAAS